MNTPAPMSDEQLNTMRRSAKDSPGVVNTMWHLLYAQAIIAARDAMWSEMLGEPHSWYSAQEDDWMTNKVAQEHKHLNSYTQKHGKFDLPLYALEKPNDQA
jgi:predicted dehydrogenase